MTNAKSLRRRDSHGTGSDRGPEPRRAFIYMWSSDFTPTPCSLLGRQQFTARGGIGARLEGALMFRTRSKRPRLASRLRESSW